MNSNYQGQRSSVGQPIVIAEQTLGIPLLLQFQQRRQLLRTIHGIQSLGAVGIADVDVHITIKATGRVERLQGSKGEVVYLIAEGGVGNVKGKHSNQVLNGYPKSHGYIMKERRLTHGH